MVAEGTDVQMTGAVNTVKGDGIETATTTDAPADAMIAVHAARIDRRANVPGTEAGVIEESRGIEVATVNVSQEIATVDASVPEAVINVIKAAAEARTRVETDDALAVATKVVVIDHDPSQGVRTMEAVGTIRSGTDPRVRTRQGLHQRRRRSATSRQSLCLQKTAAWSAGGLGTEAMNGGTG